jgi:hypothetical protein
MFTGGFEIGTVFMFTGGFEIGTALVFITGFIFVLRLLLDGRLG